MVIGIRINEILNVERTGNLRHTRKHGMDSWDGPMDSSHGPMDSSHGPMDSPHGPMDSSHGPIDSCHNGL